MYIQTLVWSNGDLPLLNVMNCGTCRWCMMHSCVFHTCSLTHNSRLSLVGATPYLASVGCMFVCSRDVHVEVCMFVLEEMCKCVFVVLCDT